MGLVKNEFLVVPSVVNQGQACIKWANRILLVRNWPVAQSSIWLLFNVFLPPRTMRYGRGNCGAKIALSVNNGLQKNLLTNMLRHFFILSSCWSAFFKLRSSSHHLGPDYFSRQGTALEPRIKKIPLCLFLRFRSCTRSTFLFRRGERKTAQLQLGS